MNKILIAAILSFASFLLHAQGITGQWNGILKVQGTQLRVVFNISKTAAGYSSTMDSPDQGAKGIPVTTTGFENAVLTLSITAAGIAYEGTLNKDSTIIGNFKQAGQSFPLNLSKAIIEKATTLRPQEPAKPYPYYSEEVNFTNIEEGVTLAGTLTLPKKEGVFAAVVLISGSGPQNREEELLGHKPFLVLSDYLTKNGIAVLRFDDRGTASSTGDFKTATTFNFATDVTAAVNYLKTRKEINHKKIGLLGHSEGGLIAPIVAAKLKEINFIVLMAGPGTTGEEILLQQQELIGRANGTSEAELKKATTINRAIFNLIAASSDTTKLKLDLASHLEQTLKNLPEADKPEGISASDFVKQQVNVLTSPWMVNFIKYDPTLILRKVHCAVLAIAGAKDLQVPPLENLAAIKLALEKGKNKKITIKEFAGLNHLFQESTTGSPLEYSTIEQTISPLVLEEVTKWIKNQVE